MINQLGSPPPLATTKPATSTPDTSPTRAWNDAVAPRASQQLTAERDGTTGHRQQRRRFGGLGRLSKTLRSREPAALYG